MKRFWPQFSSLLAFQPQLNDSEVMLNKTKKQKLWTEKGKTPSKSCRCGLNVRVHPPGGQSKLQATSQYFIFQDAPCQCRRGGVGGGQSGGYHGEGAHGVKFVCLMM